MQGLDPSHHAGVTADLPDLELQLEVADDDHPEGDEAVMLGDPSLDLPEVPVIEMPMISVSTEESSD